MAERHTHMGILCDDPTCLYSGGRFLTSEHPTCTCRCCTEARQQPEPQSADADTEVIAVIHQLLVEIRDHLYTKQDIDRVRYMARELQSAMRGGLLNGKQSAIAEPSELTAEPKP